MEKEDSEPEKPRRPEVRRVLALLNEEVARSRRSQREIERTLGVGQGYVGSVLKGRIALKVSHLFDFGETLGFDPAVLMLKAAPPEDPSALARELGMAPDQRAALPPPMTREEVEELVRRTVRQELARLGSD